MQWYRRKSTRERCSISSIIIFCTLLFRLKAKQLTLLQASTIHVYMSYLMIWNLRMLLYSQKIPSPELQAYLKLDYYE